LKDKKCPTNKIKLLKKKSPKKNRFLNFLLAEANKKMALYKLINSGDSKAIILIKVMK
jgi:hypothetical protein